MPRAGVLLHVDLTAAVGKVDIHLKEMKADIATFPHGLWFRQGVRISPFIQGSEPEMIGALDPFQLAAFDATYELNIKMLEIARSDPTSNTK